MLVLTGFTLALALIAVAGGPSEARPQAPRRLRCEYRVDPLGIDVPRPRLSWEVSDRRRDAVQSAYQVVVAETEEALAAHDTAPGSGDPYDRKPWGPGLLWDSGKVSSERSNQVAYDGRRLRSGQVCVWRVRTWDAAGAASPWSRTAVWSMGLLKPEDWEARWIEDPADVPPSLPARNGYHSQFTGTPEADAWVVLDLGESRALDGVRLFPARPFDWAPDTPGFLFPLRFRVEVCDEPGFHGAATVVDRTEEDVPNPGTEPLTLRFPRHSGRYLRLAVTRLRERDAGHHAFALAEMQALEGDRNVAEGAAVAASGSIESGAWSARFLTDGDLTSHAASDPGPRPSPLLRRSFRLEGEVRRATAYVTALGLYELRLNGRRVGDHLLAPEWTDYHRRVQYQTYDVTGLLRQGENVVGALLGEGWYAGRIGLASIVPGGPARGIYGPKPRLLAQVEIEMADGRQVTVVTDEAWRSTPEGPVRSSDILDGEVVDARREPRGWDAPDFDDSAWAPVKLSPPTGASLVAQPNEPIRVTRELKPVALTEPKPGVYVYDLGQNMVGWARLRLHGPRGTTVTLRHAEALNPDGTVYTANLRGAAQTDRYTLRGGREVFEPHFTYHGFRYVEVTGLPRRPALGDLTGRVFHSSSPEAGSFACSSPMLNRLWSNILWTQRANLMSSPTDCPQRDERLGWMGDIQAFSQTAIYNLDMAAFFTKWLRDVRDAQTRDGRFPDFAPHPFGPEERFSGAPAWADAGVVVPWRAYVNYGDRRLLEEHFEAARRWVDFVRERNPDLVWRQARGNDYNDWLNADTLVLEGWPRQGGAVPQEVLATAFFAHSADLVSRMARVLERFEDAQRYAALHEDIQAAFNRAFVTPEGRVQGDTQAGYALALSFDLLPEPLQPAALEHLLEGIRRYGGHLSTGIQTTHRLMLELARRGQTDEAYRLLNLRTIPSWGYTIDQGATTVWERWDGWVEGRGFQDPGMNSLNHWALGAVGEWMVRVILGISPDEELPGYRRFTVRPQPGGSLTWARGEYRSIRGPIRVEWRREEDRLTLKLSVPANTSAVVYVPATSADAVSEGGRPVTRSQGIDLLRREDGAVVLAVGAGRYTFVSTLPGNPLWKEQTE